MSTSQTVFSPVIDQQLVSEPIIVVFGVGSPSKKRIRVEMIWWYWPTLTAMNAI